MKISRLLPVLLLSTLLASCGGGTGESPAQAPQPVSTPVPTPAPNPTPTSTPTPTPTPAPTTPAGPNVLFVGDFTNKVIAAFDVLAPAGPGAINANILSSDFSIANGGQVDATRDLLYVGAFDKIGVFANASTLTGKITPVRIITPVIATNAYIGRGVMDSANDRLYVAFKDAAANRSGLAVFDHVSTLNGTVKPTRLVTGPFDEFNYTIDLKRGILYTKLSHLVNAAIDVYANVDKTDGVLPITRRIALNGNAAGLTVDAERDILYATLENKGLTMLGSASTPGAGSTIITPILPISGYPNSGLMQVDSRNDRLYFAFNNKAFLLNSASKIGQSGQQQVLAFSAATNFNVTAISFR